MSQSSNGGASAQAGRAGRVRSRERRGGGGSACPRVALFPGLKSPLKCSQSPSNSARSRGRVAARLAYRRGRDLVEDFQHVPKLLNDLRCHQMQLTSSESPPRSITVLADHEDAAALGVMLAVVQNATPAHDRLRRVNSGLRRERDGFAGSVSLPRAVSVFFVFRSARFFGPIIAPSTHASPRCRGGSGVPTSEVIGP